MPRIKIYIIIFFLLSSFSAISQAEFDEIPMDGQFYQRDDNSKAIVSFSGKINQVYEKIAFWAYRNDKLITYAIQNLNFHNGRANFSFQNEIKAELAEYSFKLYLKTAKDSILIADRKRIVAGETILMYGQSNAQAQVDIENYEFNSEWGRTVNLYDIPNGNGYWMDFITLNKHFNGIFALEIAKNIIEKEKIPVCLLNGAEGLKTIIDLSLRNESNPLDWNTIYGRFLTKIQFAKLLKSARILVWRQGENEAFDPPLVAKYAQNFDRFRTNLKTDLPALKKIFVIQNNVLTYQSSNAGDMREVQRSLQSKYSEVETVASVGTPTHDGLHYKKEGYIQNGFELSRLIQKDFFNGNFSKEIHSPNLKKAFFTSKKDSIILIFDDESIKMEVQKELKLSNNQSRSINDFFYLDGKNGQVLATSSFQNRVILKLKEPSIAKTINYLPHYFIDLNTTGSYTGPFLTNSLGMRALTFSNFQIAEKIADRNLHLSSVSFTQNQVNLEWNQITNENAIYQIERSIDDMNKFEIIARISKPIFQDNQLLKPNSNYHYRLKVENEFSESNYSNIVSFKTPDLLFKSQLDENSLFPNPILKGNYLNFYNKNQEVVEIQIYNILGIEEMKFSTEKSDIIEISIENLNVGVHFIKIIKNDSTSITKKIYVN